MDKVIIYHNPRWSKSREAVQLLKENGFEPEIVEYLKHPLSISELRSIAQMLDLRPKDFIRKTEQDFKNLNLQKYMNNDEELFSAMEAYPKLIERPIVVKNGKAIMGRPPENVIF